MRALTGSRHPWAGAFYRSNSASALLLHSGHSGQALSRAWLVASGRCHPASHLPSTMSSRERISLTCSEGGFPHRSARANLSEGDHLRDPSHGVLGGSVGARVRPSGPPATASGTCSRRTC